MMSFTSDKMRTLAKLREHINIEDYVSPDDPVLDGKGMEFHEGIIALAGTLLNAGSLLPPAVSKLINAIAVIAACKWVELEEEARKLVEEE